MSTDNTYVSDFTKTEKVKLDERSNMIEQINNNFKTIRNQEKEKYINDHKVKLDDREETFFRKPRSGCKHCHGRGFEGFYASNSKILPLEPTLCRCLTNRLHISGEMSDSKDKMSYGQFKDMLAKARQVYNLKEPQNEELVTDSVQDDGQENDQSGDQGKTTADNTNDSR